MKGLYFNCHSGISGDMIVGALLDLGIDKSDLISELGKLKIKGYRIIVKKVNKKGVKATRFIVNTSRQRKDRNLKDIYEIIDQSLLNRKIKDLSKKIFFNLAKAESIVHNASIDHIHFHEVGAIDSIIDVVASAILVNLLKPQKIFASRMIDGKGKIKFSHGEATLPVPAVRELFKNIPITILNINRELSTPTGAAIITTIADGFDDDINIKVEKKGYGAGKRDLSIPNVLEVKFGVLKISTNKLVILETNIDDMNAELFGFVIDKLIKEGAVEAFIQPAVMKKNRIGILLTVICKDTLKEKIIEEIFNETTTFGIRVDNLSRVILEREIKKVKTKYGIINVKVGKYKGKIKTISPEYEDCKKLALKKGVPIKMVYDEAKIKS